MRRPAFVFVAALTLSVLAAGCAELDEFDAGLQEYVDELHTSAETSEKPLTNSEKPPLEAAGKSSEYSDTLEDADENVQRALESKDYRDLDEAIEARPYDATYQLYRAALIWAKERDIGEVLIEDHYETAESLAKDTERVAEGLILARGGSPEAYYALMFETYFATMVSFGEGSPEWHLLWNRLCGALYWYDKDHDGPTATSLYYRAIVEECPIRPQ